MSDTVKIVMSLSTRYVGSEVREIEEVDRGYWESLADMEKDTYMNDAYNDFLVNSNYGGVLD